MSTAACMDESVVSKAFLLLAGIAVVCAGLSMILCFTEDAEDHVIPQYRLCIGFDEDCSESEIQTYRVQIINRLVADNVGYRLFDAQSGYMYDGTVIPLQTIILMLADVDEEYAHFFADFCKDTFSTDAITIEKVRVNVESL